jgi:hypothetical protein
MLPRSVASISDDVEFTESCSGDLRELGPDVNVPGTSGDLLASGAAFGQRSE